ncbi:MAG: CDP-alcohol phosphatidyltransferase family protein [Gammaproteobacteria bacterium]|nr:CDP-alcohol phosphatidyltransferase family protein [Gammaproteobacteria bacterium]
MKWSILPNLLCIFRILVVLPIAFAMLDGQYEFAFTLVFIGGLTDWIDGFLSRRFGWGSRLGSILDPIADKIFIVSVFMLMAWEQWLPLWVAMFVVARELVIVPGAMAYHTFIGEYEMQPSFVSKLNTAFQIILILLTFAVSLWQFFPEWVLFATIYLMLLTTVLSGVHYVLSWGNRAVQERKKLKENGS